MIELKEYLELKNKNPDPNSKSNYHKHYDGEQEDYEKIIEYNKALTEKYPWLIPTNCFTGVKMTTTEPGFYAGCDDIPDYDYSFTELDQMPDGWRLAFGEQLCEEIHRELVKFDYVDKYRILQIKDKFASLRWYDGGTPIGKMELHGKFYSIKNEYDSYPRSTDVDYYEYLYTENDGTKVYNHYFITDKCKIPDIIGKYERLSFNTCIVCGAPAKWLSTGWINPYCNNCRENITEKRNGLIDFEPLKH